MNLYLFTVLFSAICLWSIYIGWRNYHAPKAGSRLGLWGKLTMAMSAKATKDKNVPPKEEFVRIEGLFNIIGGVLGITGLLLAWMIILSSGGQ